MNILKYFLFTFFLMYHSVCGGNGDHSDQSVFSSIRRADFSDDNTYHFWRVINYKPVTEPIMYREGYNDNSKMIVGFNNMVVFGNFENNQHYVIRVNQGLNEDANIPKRFLDNTDSDSLFEVVTLKPTTTTTTTTSFPELTESIQRKALPGYDPDKQSLNEYMYGVPLNMSKMAQAANSEHEVET